MTTALTSSNVINLDKLAEPAFERKGWGHHPGGIRGGQATLVRPLLEAAVPC